MEVSGPTLLLGAALKSGGGGVVEPLPSLGVLAKRFPGVVTHYEWAPSSEQAASLGASSAVEPHTPSLGGAEMCSTACRGHATLALRQAMSWMDGRARVEPPLCGFIDARKNLDALMCGDGLMSCETTPMLEPPLG